MTASTSQPTVSVIIPTHNFGRYIAEAIQSAQNQSLRDIEIIVIDDGSTDETVDTVSRIADERTTLVCLPKSGVSVARNIGLERARGQYVAFLDADDRWTTNKLELQVGLCEKHGLDAAFGNMRRFNLDGYLPRDHFSYFPEMTTWHVREDFDLDACILEADAFQTFAPLAFLVSVLSSSLIRRASIGSVRFPANIHIGEDWHFMLQIYERCRFGWLRATVTEMRRHDSNSYSPGEDIRPFAHMLYDVEQFISPSNRPVLKRRRGQALLALGYHELNQGSIIRSVYAYLTAVSYKGAMFNAAKHLVALPLYVALKWKSQAPK
jgi:glycosyltransferase involved in cell wall biosynthesis